MYSLKQSEGDASVALHELHQKEQNELREKREALRELILNTIEEISQEILNLGFAKWTLTIKEKHEVRNQFWKTFNIPTTWTALTEPNSDGEILWGICKSPAILD